MLLMTPRPALLALLVLLALPAGLPCAAQSASAAAAALASGPVSGVAAQVESLIAEATLAVRTDPQTVLRLTERALALLATQPDADLEARVRTQRCGYFNEHDRAAAQDEINRLRLLVPQLRNTGLRAGIFECEGELHEQSGDNAQAMALYEQAVTVAEASGEQRALANALYLRGGLRGLLGDFPRGLADLKRSMALYERQQLTVEMRTVGNGVASLYSRMGALDEARGFLEEALRSMPAGASRERVIAQHNLGRNLERSGRWDEAQRQYEQVLALARELDYVRGQVHALRGLASVRNAKGDALRALQLVDDAQRLFGSVPDEPLRARLLVQRAMALRQLRRPAEGQPLLREAIKAFAVGDAVLDEVDAREELARTASDLADWRLAYQELGQVRQISQVLLRRQIDDRFATMKAQFDSEAKARELALLHRENHAIERSLQEQRRAATLQIVAAVLASALALVLALLVWRQRQSHRQMQVLALTDELTGLPNRRRALQVLQQQVADRSGGGAVLILDVDHFKGINDSLGHATGDEVLRVLARCWSGLVGADITLGRLGGEEFVAIVGSGGREQAIALGEQLRAAAANLDLSAVLGSHKLSVSAGVAVLQADDTDATVLARADQALYRAKAGGRNRVEVAA